jgi:glutathione S-transferase
VTNILYSFRRCPYAIRARMALLVARVPVIIHEVDLREKPAAMTAASPKGTVPVLVLATGQVIAESLEIMRWALRQNDPDDWLASEDGGLVEMFDTQFKAHLDRYKYAAQGGTDPIANRDVCETMLGLLEDRLITHRNLCEDAPAFTDIAVLPFVRQFAAVDRAWFDELPLPRLRAWLADHLSSPLFVQAMAK